MRETAERGDKSRPKPALSSTHAGNGKEKKKRIQSFLCVLPRRGHLLAQLRGESGQMCVRCYNPSSDGLQEQSIITTTENIYICGVHSCGLRGPELLFFLSYDLCEDPTVRPQVLDVGGKARAVLP